MSHTITDEQRNGRHRATCSCGWQTHWCVTRDDADHLAMRHADHHATKGD